MKNLFYNPSEMPTEAILISKILGIDKHYQCSTGDGPVHMDELFKLAATETFDEVKVLLTQHNEAYYRKTKTSAQKFEINGWISLKEYRNGGGYLNDKANALY